MLETAEAVEAVQECDPTGRPRRRTDRAFVAACAGSLAFSALVIWRQRFRLGDRPAFVLLDDAMISMTYGRNLTRGEGLVWNAGGPRVEGITNPLWSAWMGVLQLLPIGDLQQPALVMLSSAGLLVALLAVVRALARRAAPDDPWVATAAVVLTATFFPLVHWSLGGLEVGLLAVLLGAALLVALRLVETTTASEATTTTGDETTTGDDRVPGHVGRDAALFAALALAATATRVDAVVGLVALAVAAVVSTPRRHRRRLAVLLGGPVVGALVAVTAARLAYYGELLPNTYYLKATGTALDVRVATGARHLLVGLWAHLAAFAAVVAAGAWGSRARWSHLATTLVVTQVAYSVWVGGDSWEDLLIANRHLCLAVAPATVLAAVGIRRLSRAPRQLAAVLAGLAVTLVAGLVTLASNVAVSVGELQRRRELLRREVLDHRWAYVLLVAGLLVAAVALWRSPPAAGTRGSRSRGPALLGAATLVLVVVLTNLRATTSWVDDPQLSIGTERYDAAYGLALREATDPDASVALLTAGATPFFADRPGVDLLGKSDAHIARLSRPGATTFWAGHDKYDLRWSVEHWQPDLVNLGLWHLNGANHEILTDLGYHHLAQTTWVRDDTTAVDEPRLARLLDEAAAAHPLTL